MVSPSSSQSNLENRNSKFENRKCELETGNSKSEFTPPRAVKFQFRLYIVDLSVLNFQRQFTLSRRKLVSF